MAVQYWVADFYMDLSRNQITQKEQSQAIAPKALAVLTYLAENQGKVVSYDELFEKVWPDTVVTPNTLQRSIAQLRKVLGQNNQLNPILKPMLSRGIALNVKYVGLMKAMQIALVLFSQLNQAKIKFQAFLMNKTIEK